MTQNNSAKGRIPFIYNGQKVYEWEQTLEEIIIYIKAPECVLPKNKETIKKHLKPGEQMPKLEIKMTPKHLSVGLVGLPPYLSEDLEKIIKSSESLWELDNDEIVITLQKAIKGETWLCAFKGHKQIDFFQKEEMQKKMLLERFQEENKGFDFSGAEINGNVPDPRTFMGGLKYS